MPGEKLQMWVTKLKIAIIEKNADALDALLDNIPDLEEKDVEQAIYLLRAASEMIYTLKDESIVSIDKITKSISFMRSTERPAANKFDIKY